MERKRRRGKNKKKRRRKENNNNNNNKNACLLVALLSSNMFASPKDGSAQTSVLAATLRQKLQNTFSITKSHSILTPRQPF